MNRKKAAMPLFALATLSPVVFLTLSALFGGAWSALALIYMTVFTYGLDMLVKFSRTSSNPEAEFPAAERLSLTLAVAHFILLPLVVYSLAHSDFSLLNKIFLFWAAGLFFGQVSNSNAHEMVHHSGRRLRQLGTWVYISVLFGHHTSAHTRVHHVYVATDNDPNSAPLGQSVYHFLPRAWWGSFTAGYAAETALRARSAHAKLHPYVTYCAGAAACMIAAFCIGGFASLFIYLGISMYATLQLLLSDYVQHYGLRRARLSTGKYEPVGAAHSWNSPHWFSAFVMLNAPKHSDHHAHPKTPYVALEISPDMPMLPRPLPAMATLALVPALWRRVMDKRVQNLAATRGSD